MQEKEALFKAANQYDFDSIRKYVEGRGDLNICNERGHSLLTCFVDGYYGYEANDPDEVKLRELYDKADYAFWDQHVSKFQRTPLENRPSGILEAMDFFFAHEADPNLCVLVDGITETALMRAVCWHDYYLSKYLLEHGADPGVWLSAKEDHEKRDRDYWLMDELDISILQGDKGDAATVTLHIAQLLWEYGLRDWRGLCIDIEKDTGVIG